MQVQVMKGSIDANMNGFLSHVVVKIDIAMMKRCSLHIMAKVRGRGSIKASRQRAIVRGGGAWSIMLFVQRLSLSLMYFASGRKESNGDDMV